MRRFVFCCAMLVLGGGAAVGCDAAEPSEPTASGEPTAELRGFQFSSGGGCRGWECGYNAAEVNGRSLAELNLGGLENAGGLTYEGLLSPLGLPGWTLSVRDGELVATKNGVEKRGHDIVGFKLLVEMPLLGLPWLSITLPVTITSYEEFDSWTASPTPLATYTLLYVDLNNPLLLRNVCNSDLLDPLMSRVTVLYGERYDAASKTVNPGSGWVNFACAGSALAKMKMLNYGPQADFDGAGSPATAAQRQATLKMITADYCGTGQSFTENGTPLLWENASGSVELGEYWTPGEVEAVWTESGALCLDEARLGEAAGAIPCAIPACDTFDVDDGEWLTVNPA